MPGTAAGRVLVCESGLSLWGGVDPSDGRIIDAHHPQHGQRLAGKVVAMPTSRGSCSGSSVLLELVLNGNGPAALVFREHEAVITLGALVASHLFQARLPVLQLSAMHYQKLQSAREVQIADRHMTLDGVVIELPDEPTVALDLTAQDRAKLAGAEGAAVQVAMEVLVAAASARGAPRLTDVTRAHIDACIYATPAHLSFAEKFAALGAQVAVPTTLNAISVDYEKWRVQGVMEDFGRFASRLADLYVSMGASPSFTCAPYQLREPPAYGERIGWSESNAVIYANSVLGARSPKHPDFMDLFIALTGRAPFDDVYLDDRRRPGAVIDVELPVGYDDSLWPLLGWLCGELAPDCIPLLTGLEGTDPSDDDLRALCAAFGTTSAAPMVHVAGVTPEASLEPLPGACRASLRRSDLLRAWQTFNQGPERIDLVALGSPHFSLEETRRFARLLDGRLCAANTSVIITLSRASWDKAVSEGLTEVLHQSGVQLVRDLCWCSISEPVFPRGAAVLITNSGKYAHYAPGLSGRQVRFGNLQACARAALLGHVDNEPPSWLQQSARDSQEAIDDR